MTNHFLATNFIAYPYALFKKKSAISFSFRFLPNHSIPYANRVFGLLGLGGIWRVHIQSLATEGYPAHSLSDDFCASDSHLPAFFFFIVGGGVLDVSTPFHPYNHVT